MRPSADRALGRLTAELAEVSVDDLGLILDAFSGAERKRLEALLASQRQAPNLAPAAPRPPRLLPGLSAWLIERLAEEDDWRLDGAAPRLTPFARNALAECAAAPVADKKRLAVI